MTYQPRTHELGLFSAARHGSSHRPQPRDTRGRFVRVRYSAERLKILATARAMRARLGLSPSPWLSPFGGEQER